MGVMKLKGVEVVFYETAEKMTMKRYQRFNKYLMIDNEVGSDFGSFDAKLAKAVSYLKKGMTEPAAKELDNFRQMVYNSFMNYSPQNMALALLVRSIGGEPCNDITAKGLEAVLDKLEDLEFSKELALATIADVKKK